MRPQERGLLRRRSGPARRTAVDQNRTAEANLVKKMILDSVAARLGEIGDGAGNLDEPLPDSAKLQVALAYLKGRLTLRAVPGIEQLHCGLDNRIAGCPTAKPGQQQGLRPWTPE